MSVPSETSLSPEAHRKHDCGGVLSALEIVRLHEADPEFIEPFHKHYLRDASYEVRLARDVLVLPDGSYVKQGSKNALREPLVLQSGDSAYISTTERLRMPAFIAGTVTLRSAYANQGLLLLSGALIAPRYGEKAKAESLPAVADTAEARDRRLHFFVVNLGSQPIVLEPEGTPFAAVQFLTVAGELRKDPGAARRGPRRPLTTLGFIEKLKDVTRSCEELEKAAKRDHDLLHNLIIVGYFVLGTAILSASLGSILTLTREEALMTSVYAAVPDSDAGKMLMAATLLSVATVIVAAAVVFGPRRRPPRAERYDPREKRREAEDALQSRRRFQLMVTMLIAIVVCIASAFGAHELGGGWWWLVEIVLGAVALGVIGWMAFLARAPHSHRDVSRTWTMLTMRCGHLDWDDEPVTLTPAGEAEQQVGHFRWWWLFLRKGPHEPAKEKAVDQAGDSPPATAA